MRNIANCKAWHRQDYLDKKEYYLQRDRDRYFRFRRIVQETKNRPCADCGREYPYYVMDFDHRDPEVKIREVSNLKCFSSETKLREEIAKCDVICSNCHRERTHKKSLGRSDSVSLLASKSSDGG